MARYFLHPIQLIPQERELLLLFLLWWEQNFQGHVFNFNLKPSIYQRFEDDRFEQLFEGGVR